MGDTQQSMSNETEDTVIIGPPLPDGVWELTPRPADALDDAKITIVEIPPQK